MRVLDDAPVDKGLFVVEEDGVDGGEGTAAEEATVCRKRGGVWRFDQEVRLTLVVFFLDESAFVLGVFTPQDEDKTVFFFCQSVDDGVGEEFPAFAKVRERSVL